MAYGLKIYDAGGDSLLVTPDILSIYDGGRNAMPTSGTSGSSYEHSENLNTAYAEADIGVLVDSWEMGVDLTMLNISIGGWYMQSWFFGNNFDFFDRNESTGVLTTWTPNTTSIIDYDGLLSIYPTAFWDKRDGSTFSTINIFAGTAYLGYDQSASTSKQVYSVGTEGVENVDWIIFLRGYQGE